MRKLTSKKSTILSEQAIKTWADKSPRINTITIEMNWSSKEKGKLNLQERSKWNVVIWLRLSKQSFRRSLKEMQIQTFWKDKMRQQLTCKTSIPRSVTILLLLRIRLKILKLEGMCLIMLSWTLWKIKERLTNSVLKCRSLLTVDLWLKKCSKKDREMKKESWRFLNKPILTIWKRMVSFLSSRLQMRKIKARRS